MSGSMITALKELDPDLFTKLHQEITEEKIYRYLKLLADTYAPSQSVPHTRARVLEKLLAEDGILQRENITFDRNYKKTGNSVLLVGRNERQKDVWLLAHLDIISYLLEPPVDGRYPLVPMCYHMMPPGKMPGVALAYNLDSLRYEIAIEGSIITDQDGNVYFEPDRNVPLRAGQRVCFFSELLWNRETGELQGNLDDIAGAVSLVLAAVFLAGYEIEVMLGLTDEEEGIAGDSNQTICRGGARLLRYFDQPELVIATDIHESAPMVEGGGPLSMQQGDGASFAEKASHNRGEITPPHLYELQRRLGEELRSEGIRLTENVGGYLSRTEGVNAMLRTPNVALIGFLGKDRHFQEGVTTSNMRDLVDLAKAVVCYTLLTKTKVWKDVMA